jgi:protein gp37
VRDIRDQCDRAGVALFVKQLGSAWARSGGKADDPALWPEDLRIREMPPMA